MVFTNSYRFICPMAIKSTPILAGLLGFGSSNVFAQESKPATRKVKVLPLSEPILPESTDANSTDFSAADVLRPKPPNFPSGGVAVPILHISMARIKINKHALNAVLDKIGNRPFAIYSINGPARSGKSFLLNYCIRYLKSTDKTSWIDNKPSDTNEFEWKSESNRTATAGINIWSEPLELTLPNGSRIPVLLLDCQSAFDDEQNTMIIFAISALLSSVLIFNVHNQLEERSVQLLQLFATYSNALSVSLEERVKAGQNYGGGLQQLIVLIRDFAVSDYKHGWYSDKAVPIGQDSARNYKSDTLDANAKQRKEVQQRRNVTQEAFDAVGVYLMPNPGISIKRKDEDRAEAELDPEFKHHLQQSIELIFNPAQFVTKKINGKEITATEFKHFINAWPTDFHSDDNKQVLIQNIRTANITIQYNLARNKALDSYRETMNKITASNYQIQNEKLLEAHSQACGEAHGLFSKEFKFGLALESDDGYHSKSRDKFENEFKEASKELLENYVQVNNDKKKDTSMQRVSVITAVGAGVIVGGGILYKLLGSSG